MPFTETDMQIDTGTNHVDCLEFIQQLTEELDKPLAFHEKWIQCVIVANHRDGTAHYASVKLKRHNHVSLDHILTGKAKLYTSTETWQSGASNFPFDPQQADELLVRINSNTAEITLKSDEIETKIKSVKCASGLLYGFNVAANTLLPFFSSQRLFAISLSVEQEEILDEFTGSPKDGPKRDLPQP